MELPNIMHPVAKHRISRCIDAERVHAGEIRPTIGQQMETGDQRFGDLVFRQLAPNVWQHTSYLDMPGFRGSRFQQFDRQGWRPRAGGRYRLDR